ncbi:hypothetical protein ACFLRF_03140 [Candidatus Altiarchaeota archaeon]
MNLFVKRIFLIFFGFFLFFSSLEFYFWYGPSGMSFKSLYSVDPVLGWDYMPNSSVSFTDDMGHESVISIDANGLREDNDFSSDRPTVIVLGDSFAANIGLNSSDVYTDILEDEFFSGVNVINFGVKGYGIVQDYLKLRDKGFDLDPDLVVLVFSTGSDFMDDSSYSSTFVFSRNRPKARFEEGSLVFYGIPVDGEVDSVIHWMLRRSKALYWLYYAVGNVIGFSEHPLFPPEVRMIDDSSVLANGSFHLACDLLLSMGEELDDRNVDFLVLISPRVHIVDDEMFMDLSNDYLLSPSDRFSLNNRFRECLEAGGVDVFDLSDDLVAHERKSRGLDLYDPSDFHWNARGNMFVAEILYDHIMDEMNVSALKKNT